MKRALRSHDLKEAVADRNVAVLFHATWCPFCRSFRPVFEQTLQGTGYEALEAILDDEEDPLWLEHQIGVVPTVLFFENGAVVRRLDGRPGLGLRKSDLDQGLDRAPVGSKPGP